MISMQIMATVWAMMIMAIRTRVVIIRTKDLWSRPQDLPLLKASLSDEKGPRSRNLSVRAGGLELVSALII